MNKAKQALIVREINLRKVLRCVIMMNPARKNRNNLKKVTLLSYHSRMNQRREINQAKTWRNSKNHHEAILYSSSQCSLTKKSSISSWQCLTQSISLRTVSKDLKRLNPSQRIAKCRVKPSAKSFEIFLTNVNYLYLIYYRLK